MYLHYLLQQDKNSMLYKFFDTQQRNSRKGDWVSDVLNIISANNINLSFEQIKLMRKKDFKKLIRSKIRQSAFQHLLDIQTNKNKGSDINYGHKLETQAYLLPNNTFTVSEQQTLFSYRCRMNMLKYNYPGMDLYELCICGQLLENEHLYNCVSLSKSEHFLPYDKIFNGTISEQKLILDILKENLSKLEHSTQ